MPVLAIAGLLAGGAEVTVARAQREQPARGASVLIVQVGDTAVQPLADAEVLLPLSGLLLRVGPSGAGRFSNLVAGRHVVSARRIGYRGETRVVELTGGDTLTLAFYLEPSTTELEPVVVREPSFVNADLAEFDHRRSTGMGHFITGDQIRDQHPARLRDMLVRIPGVAVIATGHGASEVRLRRANLMTDWTRQGDCAPTYYIDGIPVARSVRVYKDGNMGSLAGNVLPAPTVMQTATVTIDNFDPSDVAGIEVYNSPAETPPQYLANGAECGVIVLWTARGKRR